MIKGIRGGSPRGQHDSIGLYRPGRGGPTHLAQRRRTSKEERHDVTPTGGGGGGGGRGGGSDGGADVEARQVKKFC